MVGADYSQTRCVGGDGGTTVDTGALDQNPGIRRDQRARAGRRARGHPGHGAGRARSRAAADPRNGPDFPGRRGRHHLAAGLVRRGHRATVVLRHRSEADHAARQANDRDRAGTRPDARAALELRLAGRGARGRAARAAADPGQDRLSGAAAQGIQRPVRLHRQCAGRIAAAHIALQRPDHGRTPHAR